VVLVPAGAMPAAAAAIGVVVVVVVVVMATAVVVVVEMAAAVLGAAVVVVAVVAMLFWKAELGFMRTGVPTVRGAPRPISATNRPRVLYFRSQTRWY